MGSPFPASPAGATKDDNLDMFGEPYKPDAPGPPMIVGVKYATLQLGKLLNDVMRYITGPIHELGGAADLKRRAGFHTLLIDFGKSLPPSLQLSTNFTHQTCFLWYVHPFSALGPRLRLLY